MYRKQFNFLLIGSLILTLVWAVVPGVGAQEGGVIQHTECAEDLTFPHRWAAVARGKLRDEFFWMRRELAEQILTVRGKRDINTAVDKWLADRRERVDQFIAIIDEMKLRSEIDFATLSVAARELRELIST